MALGIKKRLGDFISGARELLWPIRPKYIQPDGRVVNLHSIIRATAADMIRGNYDDRRIYSIDEGWDYKDQKLAPAARVGVREARVQAALKGDPRWVLTRIPEGRPKNADKLSVPDGHAARTRVYQSVNGWRSDPNLQRVLVP